jgi:hypothetical protein
MAQADIRSDTLDGHFWAKAVVGTDIWLLAACDMPFTTRFVSAP